MKITCEIQSFMVQLYWDVLVLCAIGSLWFLGTLWMMATCPVLNSLAQLLQTLPTISFMESTQVTSGLPFFLWLSIFSASWSFPETLPSRDVPESIPLILSFLSPAMFQAWFALGPTCSFFWWTRVSVELSFNTMLGWLTAKNSHGPWPIGSGSHSLVKHQGVYLPPSCYSY